MKNAASLALFFAVLFCTGTVAAQAKQKPAKWRCGTMEYYQRQFQASSLFKKNFETNQLALRATSAQKEEKNATISDTIPVVIHVVVDANLQAAITDQILQSQIDVLNEDFQGLNKDSTRIPLAFKPLYGKSRLVFKLARQNEWGEPTSGIIRTETAATFDLFNADNAKNKAAGGADAWDPNRYLNLWVVSFGSTGLLGLSVFPGDPRPLRLHGFVCDYRAFGRGASYLFPQYNLGRTTTHELGHFYNLRHIWGDDDGGCLLSDFPDGLVTDDTPDQGNATYGDPDSTGSGTIKKDSCSPLGPGIMYQNYMDYTDDKALVMFTNGQQQRMTAALTLSPDRYAVLKSNTYQSPVIYQRDARIRFISNPSSASSQCISFTPSVVLRNSGAGVLHTVQIHYSLDNGVTSIYQWNGNLLPYTETTITLSQITALAGSHNFTAFTRLPNGLADEQPSNDAVQVSFEVAAIKVLAGRAEENFTENIFPPKDWQVVNPTNDITWQHHQNIGKKSPGSAWIRDWNNATNHFYDDLVMPVYSYKEADSVILSFQLAAAVYTDPLLGQPIDTLSILLTKDCGATYTTIYKKWGDALQTIGSRPEDEFFPASAMQWRLDSINLTPWLSTSESRFQIIFRFSGNYENNIFLDDVVLYTKVLPKRLKEKTYLIFPTISHDVFSIWHYKASSALRYIIVYNSQGQAVWKKEYTTEAANAIDVNLSGKPAGVYIIHLVYKDNSSVTERIIKQ